jgi:hypothetical protein
MGECSKTPVADGIFLCIPWPINGTSPQFSQSTMPSGLHKTSVPTPSSPSKESATHMHTHVHTDTDGWTDIHRWTDTTHTYTRMHQLTYWFPLSLIINLLCLLPALANDSISCPLTWKKSQCNNNQTQGSRVSGSEDGSQLSSGIPLCFTPLVMFFKILKWYSGGAVALTTQHPLSAKSWH